MKFPYERVLAWVIGPFAVFIGGLAAKWVSSWGFLGQLGLTSSSVGKAVTAAVVFLASTAAIILPHQKWFTNLAKWWEVNTSSVSQEPTGQNAAIASLYERVGALEASPSLNVQATSPQPIGLADDDPNPTEWAATRQRIADAMPMKDPMA